MKKTILLFIALISIISFTNAQWQPAGMNGHSIETIAISGNNIFTCSTTLGIGDGVNVSSNGGGSWAQMNNGLIDTYDHDLAIIGNNMFVATNIDGVYKSTNNGNSWTAANNGLGSYMVHTFAIDGNNLYACTDSGVYVTANNGANWTALSTSGMTNVYIENLAISGSNIFAGTPTGMMMSSNNGNTWIDINNGLPLNTGIFALTINGSNIFIGTYYGVYLSTNNGSSWTSVNYGLPAYPSITSFALYGSDIFVGSWMAGVYMSSDNGATWNSVNSGFASDTVLCLSVRGDTLYAGLDSAGVWKCYIPNINIPNCSAYFTIVPDTSMIYHCDIINHATGVAPITYQWSWGDGSSDAIANPSHTYSSAGFYNICQTITDFTGCTSTFCDHVYFTPPPCHASFLDTIRHDTVSFYGFNNDPTNTFFWHFGDGSNSSLMNPVHIYAQQGTYPVSLTITTIYGCSSSSYHNVVIPPSSCSSQFTIAPDSLVPHHYYVINNATGTPPLYYYWTWGDGTYDTIAYPSHTYSTAGFYNICLYIDDATGCYSQYCDSSYLQKNTNTIISVDVISNETVGINENQLSDQIKIYPNPVTDNLLNIIVSEKSQIDILNIEGQVIKSINALESNTTIDITGFAKGMYFVKVRTEKGMSMEKFIKI